MTTTTFAEIYDHPPNWAVALACASLGWRVLPLRPSDKRPALKRWPELATTDPSVIEEWWGSFGDWRSNLVGVATGKESGIWVLDVDVKSGGIESFRRLVTQGADFGLPQTFTVRTASGGGHLYFRYPEDGREISTKANTLGADYPGLDTRGWHGQVVAPGTRLVAEDGSFGSYEVTQAVEPASAPEWLVARVEKRQHERVEVDASAVASAAGRLRDYALDALEREVEELVNVPQDGGRNDRLNRAAFVLGGLGAYGVLTEVEVRKALKLACDWNGVLAEDGEKQFDATFDSGWGDGLDAPQDVSWLLRSARGWSA